MARISSNLITLICVFGLLLCTVAAQNARGDSPDDVDATTAAGNEAEGTPEPETEKPEEEDDGVLMCYQCSSSDDGDVGEQCLDVFNTTETAVPLVNCTTEVHTGNATAEDAPPRCFKFVSSIYDAKSETGYELVSRGCAKSKRDTCTTDKTPSSGEFISCYCSEDECNSANHIYSIGIVGALAIANLGYFYL